MNTKAPGCEEFINGRYNICPQVMASPRVADGGDGLQVWRVAANILKNKWRGADKGWSSSLWVGLTTTRRKNKFIAKYDTESWTWTDSLDKRPKNDQVREDETGRECSTHGEKWNAYRILVVKPEGKRQPGRQRRRWWTILKWILEI
jgi:hypothetical protein